MDDIAWVKEVFDDTIINASEYSFQPSKYAKIMETDNYIIVETIANTRNNQFSLAKITMTLYWIWLRFRSVPIAISRLRSYIIINKQYYSIDAACNYYARHGIIKLICFGRPEAVKTLANTLKPRVITAPYDLIKNNVCRGHQAVYTTKLGNYYYSCIPYYNNNG